MSHGPLVACHVNKVHLLAGGLSTHLPRLHSDDDEGRSGGGGGGLETRDKLEVEEREEGKEEAQKQRRKVEGSGEGREAWRSSAGVWTAVHPIHQESGQSMPQPPSHPASLSISPYIPITHTFNESLLTSSGRQEKST